MNLPIRGVGVKGLIVCLFLVFPLSGTAFGQTPALVMDSTDIRVEEGSYNNVAGYNVFIRKKPGIESVMLTDPSGAHALRATEWNPVNGNERRTISGKIITGAYSQYSIVSSTPQPDEQFGSAFRLFIPSVAVYGNPTSPTGLVPYEINMTSPINIRTFDQKYADPNRSRFQDNHCTIGGLLGLSLIPQTSFQPSQHLYGIDSVVDFFRELLPNNKYLKDENDDKVILFLINALQEEDRARQRRR